MQDIKSIFDNRSFDVEKLLSFGFQSKDDGYYYSLLIMGGEFEVNVVFFNSGKITANVIDAETGEIYALINVADASGTYIGKVRAEYEKLLKEIADKCFYVEVFKSKYAKKIIEYVKNKYSDELEFLWVKFPKNAVLRRKDISKWYAALLNVQKNKIGLKGDDNIDIINLKIDSSKNDIVLDNKKYFPAYHMNKKNWVTVCLDGSVSLQEIFELIDNSYNLA